MIASADGTRIAFECSGSGPPLVLVHGSGAANPRAWTGVIPALEEHFTVCTPDRRGRGASGDSPTYAIEREFEDIAAVADSFDEPAHLLGHSFGALCALEAGLLTHNIRKLILYEPAIPLPGQTIYPEGVIDRLQTLLDADDREGLLAVLYREVAGMSPEELEQFRQSPAWAARLASAHTVVREARAEEDYRFEARRFQNLQIPTLLLMGSDSPPFLKGATEALNSALPNGRLAILPGQQHLAMYAAPEMFVGEVLSFLAE